MKTFEFAATLAVIASATDLDILNKHSNGLAQVDAEAGCGPCHNHCGWNSGCCHHHCGYHCGCHCDDHSDDDCHTTTDEEPPHDCYDDDHCELPQFDMDGSVLCPVFEFVNVI